MFEAIRNHTTDGFVALEAFLYPPEEEVSIAPTNAKIRNIGIESGLFDPNTEKWIEEAGVLVPCGHEFSINTYNNLWFWLSQKIVQGLALMLPPQEERISAAEKTNTAFTRFQNTCLTCGQTADEIIPNYALRDMIDLLKESSLKENEKVQDVWEKFKDPITLESMVDPLIRVPCGHSICAKVWGNPTFKKFRGQCQSCKQDCKEVVKNRALKMALNVLNKHFLHEVGFSAEELSKLDQEGIGSAQDIYLASPEHLLCLKDASISVDAISKLAPSIQAVVLSKPDHFLKLLKGAALSMEDFSGLSMFDQAVSLATDLEYGVRWLKKQIP